MIHHLLPEDIQKIAAGQVIDRPVNIVKELVENSIDAQATHITIKVNQGGKTHISIIDNGLGMSIDDARLCTKRHTTSKLKTFDQLNTLQTFGFRGEAIASICAVARITLITREQHALEALELSIEQGTILSEKKVSAQKGTTFTVDDLFYNIPVRKKFLKTAATEWNQILSLFKAFCFSYPTIHFILIHDDATVFNCPPVKTIKDRCDQIFEPKICSEIITLETTTEKNITLSGCISNQQINRYDRSGFYFFVNNRLVKNYQLSKAVMRGYENSLKPQQYPIALLSIFIDAQEVDINVHPKKEEVLFLHPHLVEHALTDAIKKTLCTQVATHLSTATTRGLFSSVPFYAKQTSSFQKNSGYNENVFFKEPPFTTTFEKPFKELKIEKQTPLSELFEDKKNYKIIGQCLTTYLLLEHDDGLLLIDQHAAHERILYEQLKSHFNKKETMQLLFPSIITLSKNDLEILLNYTHILKNQGIMSEAFGQDQLRITAVPVYAKEVNFTEVIHDVLVWITQEQSAPQEIVFKKITEKLHAQLACKAAIKAGDILTMEKMQQLVRDLEKVENSHSCPHGRPTQWLLNTNEIEKKFRRIL